MRNSLSNVFAAVIVLSASVALAAPSPSQKCQVSKNKSAGGYYGCRAKAEAKAVQKGATADYSKCAAKFGAKWDGAETVGAGMCPDNIAVTADVEAFIAGQATVTAALIAGTVAIPECGDGAVNAAGEHCDGVALGENTCATFGLHGALACTSECQFDLSGCSACPAPSIRYEDTCWVLGAVGANCDAACAVLGMTYDNATSTVAGSAGTDANCAGLLHLTGAPGGELDNPGGPCSGNALGCAVVTEFGFRARCGTPATDAPSSATGIQRVCACQ